MGVSLIDDHQLMLVTNLIKIALNFKIALQIACALIVLRPTGSPVDEDVLPYTNLKFVMLTASVCGVEIPYLLLKIPSSTFKTKYTYM